LFDLGFEVVRLNLRDHGATHHLNRELFHSCRLPEVVGAVRALANRFAGLPIMLGGFRWWQFHAARAADREARVPAVAACRRRVSGSRSAVTMTTLERGSSLYHTISAQVESVAREESSRPGPTSTTSKTCCASAACAR